MSECESKKKLVCILNNSLTDVSRIWATRKERKGERKEIQRLCKTLVKVSFVRHVSASHELQKLFAVSDTSPHFLFHLRTSTTFFFSLTRTASVLKSELRSVVPIRPPLAILSSSPALYCNGIDHGSIRLLSKANRTPHQYSAHWLHLALTLPPSAKTQPISALCVCVCVLQI